MGPAGAVKHVSNSCNKWPAAWWRDWRKTGIMALMLAPQGGHLYVLQYMLHDAGANAEIMNNDISLFNYAIQEAHLEVVQYPCVDACA
eukprot:10047555-Karenia_brevis.AAC.1